MRMRRKKNLDSRLEGVDKYLIKCVNEDLNYENAANEIKHLDFEELFGNNNPVVLEIGCGKGKFACTYAQQNPDVNVLAVEKVSNIIVSACENAQREGLENIRFMECAAEYLPSYIKENSISTLFLNFSCPYPKAKYAKHRLTHERFLNIYKSF